MYCSATKDKQNYHAIPGISDITADEFVKCVDVIGPEKAYQRKI